MRTGLNGRIIKSSVNGINKGIDPIKTLVSVRLKSISTRLSLDDEAESDQAQCWVSEYEQN